MNFQLIRLDVNSNPVVLKFMKLTNLQSFQFLKLLSQRAVSYVRIKVRMLMIECIKVPIGMSVCQTSAAQLGWRVA